MTAPAVQATPFYSPGQLCLFAADAVVYRLPLALAVPGRHVVVTSRRPGEEVPVPSPDPFLARAWADVLDDWFGAQPSHPGDDSYELTTGPAKAPDQWYRYAAELAAGVRALAMLRDEWPPTAVWDRLWGHAAAEWATIDAAPRVYEVGEATCIREFARWPGAWIHHAPEAEAVVVRADRGECELLAGTEGLLRWSEDVRASLDRAFENNDEAEAIASVHALAQESRACVADLRAEAQPKTVAMITRFLRERSANLRFGLPFAVELEQREESGGPPKGLEPQPTAIAPDLIRNLRVRNFADDEPQIRRPESSP